ncbi:MAG TPA: ParB/RepB/Spo0J family partition protein [Isosphaeraceae bacterium]|jgi:ParB family chromosome partitioning protein|nr:ParB/RepB/Spo0J family partition protein [Isosphaeraceae bacterium]
MSKRDELMKGLANVRESMGDHTGGAARDPQSTRGPRTTPPHLVGVVRSKDVSLIAIDRIVRDPHQPREDFAPEGLERLAKSLRQRGQLQPIRVRWDQSCQRYVIVCGERRWRAASVAGLESLACVVVEGDPSPEDRLAIQLVENALREDLQPMEQAKAYKTLMESQHWSARQLAAELSIHHAQVVRALSLLELPDIVQNQVEQGGLSPAAAYELSKLTSPAAQAQLAEKAVITKMTRQEVIEAVRGQSSSAVRGAPVQKPARVEFRIDDGITVTVRYRKSNKLSAVQALRLALKQAQAFERQLAKSDGEEDAA